MVQGIGRFTKERRDWETSIPWADLDHWVMPERANPAGVIAFPQTEENRRFLMSLKVPLVVVGPYFLTAKLPRVEWDDAAAGELAVASLSETGLDAVVFAGSTLGKCYVEGRLEGARREAEKRGMSFQTLDLAPEGHDPERTGAAADLARKWFAKREAPCGLVAATDNDGLILLRAARDADFDIPGRGAVVSIGGDNLLCAFSEPSLSSVDLPGEEVGYEAARMLADLMEGKQRDTHFVQPYRVKMRSSSDLVFCEDRIVNLALRYIRDHSDQPIKGRKFSPRCPCRGAPWSCVSRRRPGAPCKRKSGGRTCLRRAVCCWKPTSRLRKSPTGVALPSHSG